MLAATLAACAGDDSGASSSLSGGDPATGPGDDGSTPATSSSSGSTAAADTQGSGDATTTTGGTTVVADGTSSGGESSSSGAAADSSGSSTGAAGAVGCSDGEREGFLDLVVYTEIAGCAGGWDVPGILNTTDPACDRMAGDDALNIEGQGCTVADLCAEGWHVCESASDVDDKSPNGCVGATEDVVFNHFFATRQSGVGQSACSAGANDFHGCGNIGAAGLDASCDPLDRTSQDLCSGLAAPWSCPGSNVMEANQVVKPGSALGGVLCCTD
ncbi:MAG: hypothetical protein AAF721_22425 [Myxococcota bacterium]